MIPKSGTDILTSTVNELNNPVLPYLDNEVLLGMLAYIPQPPVSVFLLVAAQSSLKKFCAVDGGLGTDKV